MPDKKTKPELHCNSGFVFLSGLMGGWGYIGLYRAVWDVFLMAAAITAAITTAVATAAVAA